MPSSRSLLILALWLFALPAVALVGGRPVYSGQYPSVFMVTSHDDVLGEGFCTAAKVGAEWILTAAHCVNDEYKLQHRSKVLMKSDIEPGQKLQYTFVLQDIKGGELLDVVEVRLPPGPAKVPDVALVRVVPQGTFAKKPAAPVFRGAIRPGVHIDLVGYGAEGEGEVQQRPARLTTHGAVVSTRAFLEQETMKTGTLKEEVPAERHFFGVINWPHLAGHTNLGSGDSGGPVMLWNTQTIVGINSEGHCANVKPECQITNNSWFARLNHLPKSWWPKGIRYIQSN